MAQAFGTVLLQDLVKAVEHGLEQLLKADRLRALAAHHIQYCLDLALISLVYNQGILEE